MLRGDIHPRATSHLKVVGQLGSGGFGSVYEAIDTRTGGRVAVKELDNTTPDALGRFKQEFRALVGLHHPNLVGLKELIEQDGRWIIVMELVPGTDFLSYVRPAADDGSDEARLRKALVGMVEGLRALHGHGLLHRDLKPSNVRVRPDGTAVLLDFGVATSADPGRQSTHAAPIGTIAYMAPEQAVGRNIGPPSDLYALGVCLFEALTGQLPFDSPQPLGILLAKQDAPAPRASSLAVVPPDLDVLCAALLATDPAQRPTADDVLRALEGTSRAPRLSDAPSPPSAPRGGTFTGREGELALLERALARTHEGELRIVLVEGESGVGKSALAAEFVRRAHSERRDTLILRGRCYENEQVSYKAFDGCVDELARFLKHLPHEACSTLLPVRAALLGQLFPVLRHVKPIAWARADDSSAEPTARRLEAFSAFAALLSSLAERRSLVLVIDDLQWADAESFRLLTALTEQRPPPPILVLGSVRPRIELDPDVLAQLEQVRSWSHTDVLPIVGLPREGARKLAAKLLGPETPARWLDLIADESRGHPLFMSELVQYARSHDLGSHLKLTLEAALRARIDGLRGAARELLELVALAARPYPTSVFATALGVVALDEPAKPLLASRLLFERKGHELTCYHDRIRHAAVALIPKARLPLLHKQLANALAGTPQADPAEQARHWDLSGDRARALEAYERAVTQAIETLAFRRAIQLAARALELLDDDPQRAQALMTQRARALEYAGFPTEAAELYERAAERAEGEQRLLLRASAARTLLISSNVARGLAAVNDVLRQVGVFLPTSTLSMLLWWAYGALVVAVRRRLRRVTRPGRASKREQLALHLSRYLYVEACTAQPLLFGPLVLQVARLSLRFGSSRDLASCYAMLGWLCTATRSLRAALPMYARSRELIAESASDDEAIVFRAFSEGSGRLVGFDWLGAREHLVKAHEVCQQKLPTWPSMLTALRYHLGILWFETRAFGQIARELDAWIHEARERNDSYALAILVGHGRGFARHLMRDDPRAAHAELDEVMRPIPSAPFAFVHFGYLIGKMLTYLYEDSPQALRFLDAYEAEHEGAFLMRGRMGKEVRLIFRGFALLKAYAVSDGDERQRIARQLRTIERRLAARRSPVARGVGLALKAQRLASRGRRDKALALARDARQLIDGENATPSPFSSLIGILEGGPSGASLIDTAQRYYAEQGFRNPARALAMYGGLRAPAPGKPPGLGRVGRYEVIASLGRGGFGSVVSARDTHSGRVVALKELVREGGTPLERFKREYRALTTLHHPNLVQLEGLFEHDGRWYIVMEQVEGGDLISYVRRDGACHPDRLRASFAGVARALRTLHESGLVHRDVTPSNVLVDHDGRPVLIDFGLIARRGDPGDAQGVGSPEYAAPEQLEGSPAEPSADVYALGVCMYKAITGRHPFGEGSPLEIAAAKQQGGVRPRPPTLPGELELLLPTTERMLALAPGARPALEEVIALLEEPNDHEGEPLPIEAEAEIPFTGREDELAALQEASERSCDAGLTFALVEGESGLGKSALAREHARRVEAGSPLAWVLQSRCYENEQIALKALDGAVDQLAQRLRALPNPTCEVLLPRHSALLAQLFPVLGSVPAISMASKKGLPADPAARKVMARTALLDLLENLCRRVELSLVIDDLQWADSDSFDLLDALRERASELPILVVATLRSDRELLPSARERVDVLRAFEGTRTVALGPLDDAAARELSKQLLGERGEIARELARESRGHPLFLRELVEHEKRGLGGDARTRTLDAALARRIESLSGDARALLALIALGDKPHGTHVYARALGRAELPRDALIALLGHGLVQRRANGALACAHDRVRAAALALTPEGEIAGRSRDLADALGREPRSDPAERARLWEQAHDRERALASYEEAGARALEALAFTHAEQHYAHALDLIDVADEERARQLLIDRGHALVRAGRSAEAAASFQRAAETARGELQTRLRIWVAQHLIQSAQVSQGLAAATALLAELGVPVPSSEHAALLRIGWERTRVRLRGTELRRRQLSAREQLVLEALNGLSPPLSLVSYLTGSTLMAQYLRRALDAGAPGHAAQALGLEAVWRSLRSPDAYDPTLFERARKLAEPLGDPALEGGLEYLQGIACLARTEYAEAAERLERANDMVHARCPGQPWLLTNIRSQLGFAWWTSGQYAPLRRHGEDWLEEARARDDRSAVASLTGYGGIVLRHLFDAGLDTALEELGRATDAWPEEPFSSIHFGGLCARSMIYGAGSPSPRFSEWLSEREPQVRRAFLMRTPSCRAAWLVFRCWALCHRLESPRDPAIRSTIPTLRQYLSQLKRIRTALALAADPYYEGVIAALEGRREQALRTFAQIRSVAPPLGTFGAVAADYACCLLEGGAESRARRAAILADFSREGWRDPEIALRIRAGGLHLLA